MPARGDDCRNVFGVCAEAGRCGVGDRGELPTRAHHAGSDGKVTGDVDGGVDAAAEKAPAPPELSVSRLRLGNDDVGAELPTLDPPAQAG